MRCAGQKVPNLQTTLNRLWSNLILLALLVSVAFIGCLMVEAHFVRAHRLVACLPAFVVSAVALWRSPTRLRTAGILGILFGYAIVTVSYFDVCFRTPTFWEWVEHDFHQNGRPLAVAAITTAILDAILQWCRAATQDARLASRLDTHATETGSPDRCS